MKKLFAVILVASMLAGCGDDDALQRAEDARRDAQEQAEAWRTETREAQKQTEVWRAEARAARRQAEETERQRAAEVRSMEQRRRVAEQQSAEAEHDRAGAITMWVSTAAALAVVIFLLARERYLRRTFVKMARRLFGGEESRDAQR